MSGDRLHELIEAVSDLGILLLDAAGHVLTASAGTAAITGLRPEEIIGRHLREIYSAEDDAGLVVAARGGRWFKDGWRKRIDGGHFYAETSISCARGPDGEVKGFTVIVRDVTVRRTAEEELRLSEARYRTQFDFAPEAILTVDADSEVFVEANENAARLFAMPRKALLLRGPTHLSPPTQPDGRPSDTTMAEYVRRALAGEKLTFEWLGRDSRGVDIPIEVRMVRLPGPGRNLVRASIVDATPRKDAERLALRSAELVEQNRMIQAANRLKSEFLANMSHELRTPLNAILGFAELILDGKAGPLTEEQREYLGDVLSSGQHLLSLINGVLDLAKVEAGRTEIFAESLEIDQLVAEVADVLRSLAVQKNIQLSTRVAGGLEGLVGDASKLKQVLYNFASNALKFTEEGGSVEVSVAPEGEDFYRLAVRDTGIGIRADDVPKLFHEFQQLDSGFTKRYQGTGLGLALTKRLVEMLGGRVGVESAPGRGSAFWAVFPRILAPERRSSTLRPVRSRQSMLVVTHDPDARAWLGSVLAGAGYDVDAVSDGAEALARCAEQVYDAITLDVLLPSGGALEVFRELRAEGNNRDTPLVLVTFDAAAGGASGFAVQDVLAKPTSREQLLASLHNAGVEPGRAAKVLVVDDDPATLRWIEAMLADLGFAPFCCRGGNLGLAVVELERPAAVLLDLTMPGMNGFEFLRRLRTIDGGERLPVILWTVKDFSVAERAALAAVHSICAQGDVGRETLLAELRRQAPAPGGGSVGQ